jgi:YihY family inner membrane protein
VTVRPDLRLVERLDGYQRRAGWLGFPIAAGRKLSDDQGIQLATLISYYGFLSLFPLLLLFRTVLGYVLQGNEDLQKDILDSALARFPLIGDEIERSQGRLQGSGLALAVGIVGALWAGLGVTRAVENAMDEIWGVPRRARHGFLAGNLRGLVLLLLLGGATVVATGLSALAQSSGLVGPGLRAATIVGWLAINLGIFLVSFRVLTSRSLGWGEVLPGAALAALGWAVLQAIGGWFVGHQVQGASATYGTFALVFALLSWIYLSALLMLYAVEVNAVRTLHLWPRGLRPPLTSADRRALALPVRAEALEKGEAIEVTFDPDRSED